jgi:hypothetical protein
MKRKTHWMDWEIWAFLAAISPILGVICGICFGAWILKMVLTN